MVVKKLEPQQQPEVYPAIGIDLGSTFSCVGVWQNNWVEIVVNEQGSRKTPSVVAFRDGEQLVGDAAINQAAMNTSNTIYDLKRIIGRRFSEPSVQRDLEVWPFTVTPGPREHPLLTVSVSSNGEERRFTVDEVCAMLLRRIKEISDEFLKCDVKDCVITVPGNFRMAQRWAIATAGKLAGLNVMRIVNEPTAAACAYALHRESVLTGGESNLLIFDLGGGTLSVAVVVVEEGVIEVKALGGDSHLGGVDFDRRMVDHFVKEFKAKQGKDITGSARAMRKLEAACERAKRSLSIASRSVVDVDALFEGIDFYSSITREIFEDINMDLFVKCLRPVERCLRDSRVPKGNIHNVVLVGGSSRIPKVQELLQKFFDGKELCRSHVNPDEAVAFGAGILAGVLVGSEDEKLKPFICMEVTPRSLGLEIAGGAMTTVIPRNTSIPTNRSVDFTTYPSYGTCVLVEVYEGEEERAVDNDLVGVYELRDLPPAPPGGLHIVVNFDVDANAFMSVKAHIHDGASILCVPMLPTTPLYPVVIGS
ncbi:unnamed protein product [Calypogeia fissa]